MGRGKREAAWDANPKVEKERGWKPLGLERTWVFKSLNGRSCPRAIREAQPQKAESPLVQERRSILS